MSSVQRAVAFIRSIREDEVLRSEIERLGISGTLDDLVRIAAARGVSLECGDLRRAISIDWTMRWHRFMDRD